jgi:hypothetical protein
VSVAGLYRTGKSYLLNRVLLDRSSGFGIGPTVNAHTKGLWAWKHPIKGKGKNGEDINVIVVDSEGIGSIEESSNHDNRNLLNSYSNFRYFCINYPYWYLFHIQLSGFH